MDKKPDNGQHDIGNGVFLKYNQDDQDNNNNNCNNNNNNRNNNNCSNSSNQYGNESSSPSKTDVRALILDRNTLDPFSCYILSSELIAIKNNKIPDPGVIVIGAATDKHSVGAVVAEYEEGLMKLKSLYIDKNARRHGIGFMLVKAAAKTFAATGRPVHGLVTEYMTDNETDAASIPPFLKFIGSSDPVAASPLFLVNSADLHDFPIVQNAFNANFSEDSHVIPFSQVTDEQIKEIEEDESVNNALKPSAMRYRIMKQVSTAWVENGHVLAWLLACKSFDGGGILSACCRREPATMLSVSRLIASSANRFYMMLGHDYPVYISTIDDYSRHLVEKYTKGKFVEYNHFYSLNGTCEPDWLAEINDNYDN